MLNHRIVDYSLCKIFYRALDTNIMVIADSIRGGALARNIFLKKWQRHLIGSQIIDRVWHTRDFEVASGTQLIVVVNDL